MVFNTLDLRIQKLIKEKGFIEPTLPQKLSIGPIIKGENVLVIAPTGIGKTEVACLPVFHKLVQSEHKPISALYITPLRSLNRDLLDRLFWWADKLDIEIGVRHGDTTQAERTSQREAPPHFLITTPETLGAVLTGKIMREHLKNIKYVIIDEIHELVDSKRGIQMSVLLERLREIAGDFQRIGLSATVGSPQIVADFLGKNVKIIHADAVKEYDIKVEAPSVTVKGRQTADDLAIGETTTARLLRLHEFIKENQSVLTFTNTRETAEVLSSRLRTLDKDLKQGVHHGSLSKEHRITSEQKFKAQELKSLIATSSLELGIDIGSIDLVVQYLSPRQVSRLIQRVGRSGHGVGKISKGIILSGDEDIFESVVIARHAMRKELEKVRMHNMAMDVLAPQIIGLSFEYYDLSANKVFEIIKRAYPYHGIKRKDFDDMLKFLESLRLIWLNETPGDFLIRRRRRAWTFYFENLSTIPVTLHYRIISIIQNEPIGTLDEEFVAEHGQPGNKFVCAGRAWKIIQLQGNKVIVEPVEDIESAIPSWEGELIPVPFAIAQGVGKLRRLISSNSIEKVKTDFKLDTNSIKTMQQIISKQSASHIVPDDRHFLIENYKDFVILHSCCGSLINDTIGKYLASILTAETGVAVNIKSDPYRIMLQTTAKAEDVKRILEEAANVEDVIKSAIERSSMFKYRFIHVARRFGIISRDAKYDKINLNKIVAAYSDTPAYGETLREIFLEKLDMEGAKEIIQKIKGNEIKLTIQQGLSHLGELGLVQQFSEVMKPRMPQKEIQRAFRKRMLATRVRLLCTNCGDYNLVRTVKDIEDQPECPKCDSRLIAVLRKRQDNAQDIVKKKLKKKELTKEEANEFQTIRRSADLVVVYGRKAVEALAGHGIGPQTAARILAMMHTNREKFYNDILEAEKQFARTKIYWK